MTRRRHSEPPCLLFVVQLVDVQRLARAIVLGHRTESRWSPTPSASVQPLECNFGAVPVMFCCWPINFDRRPEAHTIPRMSPNRMRFPLNLTKSWAPCVLGSRGHTCLPSVAMAVQNVQNSCYLATCCLMFKVIDAYAKSGQPQDAVKVLQDMQARKLQPDLVAFSSIVDAFSRLGKVGPSCGMSVDSVECSCAPTAFLTDLTDPTDSLSLSLALSLSLPLSLPPSPERQPMQPCGWRTLRVATCIQTSSSTTASFRPALARETPSRPCLAWCTNSLKGYRGLRHCVYGAGHPLATEDASGKFKARSYFLRWHTGCVLQEDSWAHS